METVYAVLSPSVMVFFVIKMMMKMSIFVPLNDKLLCKKLEDIGMHLRVREPLQGTVSWTDKPMPYFVHQVWAIWRKQGEQKSFSRLTGVSGMTISRVETTQGHMRIIICMHRAARSLLIHDTEFLINLLKGLWNY